MRYKVIALHVASYIIVDEQDENRIVAKAGNEGDADKVAEGLNLVEEQDQYIQEMGNHHETMMHDYFEQDFNI